MVLKPSPTLRHPPVPATTGRTGRRRLLRLHFLARPDGDAESLVPLEDGHHESGNWRVTERIAMAAIGAELHLHERPDDRSWAAGRVNGWRWHERVARRIVFRFWRDDSLCRDEPGGWGAGLTKHYVWAGRA